MNIKDIVEGKSYYTLVSKKAVYRNCTWAFAEEHAKEGDLLFTIKDGLLHHIRIRITVKGQFTTNEWDHLHRDKDWFDMELHHKGGD